MSEKSIIEFARFKHFPSLPHVLLKLMEVSADPEVSIKEISNIIGKDPGLTGKLLHLINSAHFGFPKKVGKLDQAVNLLGIEAIRGIAISSSIHEAFQHAPQQPGFELKHFWWHSLRCALLSRLLAQSAGYPNPEEAFLVGLLHDLGRLLLWMNFPGKYGELVAVYQDRPELMVAAEDRLIAGHPALGAGLLEHWQLGSLPADAVRYHHEPPERIRNALPLVQIVYLANALSGSAEPLAWNRLGPIAAILNLQAADTKNHLVRVDQEIAEIADVLGIVIERPELGCSDGESSDRDKLEQINQYGKRFALVFATLRNLVGARDVPRVVRELRLGLASLFEFSNPLFLVKDWEQERLTCWSLDGETGSGGEPDWFVPLAARDCLVIASFTRQTPLVSFDRAPGDMSLLDQQLIRHLGKPGIYCQPLADGGESQGVVVLGLDRADYQRLNGERELLDLFAAQAGARLQAISAQKVQAQVVQEERLQAFTDLARKIVHEVNNPLALIKNYLKILDLKLSERQIHQEEIGIVNEEIDRVSELLAGLTRLSHAKLVKTEAVSVNRLLIQLCKIAGEPLRATSNVEIELQLERDLPPIMADLDALRQVFVNLVKNAAEAMATGGHLRIQTRSVGRRLAPAGAKTTTASGRVEIIVEDNGPGVPESIKSKIFEPYVGSKGESHSGLGLSVVHNIIRGLNGNISVESEAGHGARFVVSFPALAADLDGKTSTR